MRLCKVSATEKYFNMDAIEWQFKLHLYQNKLRSLLVIYLIYYIRQSNKILLIFFLDDEVVVLENEAQPSK